jgi:Mg-chelatase subunit ChlD
VAHVNMSGDSEYAEAPWISMTDLFILVAVLLLGAGTVMQRQAREANRASESLLRQIKTHSEEHGHATELQRAVAGGNNWLELSETNSAEELASVLASVARLEETVAARTAELASHAAELARASSDFERYKASQGDVRKEILGIDGSLDRVVFVVDRSLSMNDENRWNLIRETAIKWLTLLPVKQVGVVIFSDDAKSLLGSAKLVDADDTTRATIAGALSELTPSGLTNTAAAIRMASTFGPVDAVILLTDGQPDDPAAALQAIDDFKSRLPDARLHIVGLGDYFLHDYGQFIRAAVAKTGGAFVGR